MRSVFGHYCGRFRAEETKIDCGRGSDRKNLALINVVERYFFIELPGRSCRLCLGDAFGNLSASKKEFRRMCGCQCNDSLEALTSRAKTERCITTKLIPRITIAVAPCCFRRTAAASISAKH